MRLSLKSPVNRYRSKVIRNRNDISKYGVTKYQNINGVTKMSEYKQSNGHISKVQKHRLVIYHEPRTDNRSYQTISKLTLYLHNHTEGWPLRQSDKLRGVLIWVE